MEALMSAADAILNDKGSMILSSQKISRPVFKDITNRNIVLASPEKVFGSSLEALFNDKITSHESLKPKPLFLTPGKRRKISMKYGDENKAPSPKTPKNSLVLSKFIESPATPLSNLKMLTRVASMEEPIPSKRNLFLPSSDLSKSKLGLRRCISENATDPATDTEQLKIKLKRHPTSSDLDKGVCSQPNANSNIVPNIESRRDKSLGLLCERFLDHFPMEVSCLETPRRLVIDDVASFLGTERRRVYDIVNILECLNMASRVQKNMYQWMGKQHLELTLSNLKGLAQELGICVPVNKDSKNLSFKDYGNTPGTSSTEKLEARKEKSIGILCQKFLMLFLTTPFPHVIQLDTAVQLLLGQEGDALDKLRTRGRRIYDIANVLISLHLIQKIPQCKSFIYIGPKVDAAKSEDVLMGPSKWKLRHSLLPPPLVNLVPPKGVHAAIVDNENTPLERADDKTKLRKAASSSFAPCRAKRNCLVGRTKSEETKLESGSSLSSKRQTSLQDICEVAEVERDKLMKETSDFAQNKPIRVFPSKCIPETIKSRLGKTFRFPYFTSPRVALTFQNCSTQQLPTKFTNQPPCASKVIVKPPFIVRKVNISPSSFSQQNHLASKKPVYVIQTSSFGQQSGNETDLTDNANKSFRVYSQKSKQFRTLSLPDINKPSSEGSTCDKSTPKSDSLTSVQTKGYARSLSQMTVPNINFNTLSKSHYKTVFGSSSQMNKHELTSPKEGSYHFVINPKENNELNETLRRENAKILRPPTFVKIFQSSPDNSSTDSELESIFGDSFKFTRPKNLSKNY